MSLFGTTKKFYKDSKIVEIQRECSRCKHEWIFKRTVTAEGRGETYSPENAMELAREDARKKLESEVDLAMHDSSTGVLCPKCGHFDKEATSEFLRNGYAAFLLLKFNDEWRDCQRMCIIGPVIATILAVIGVFAFKGMIKQTGEFPFWSMFLFIACSSLCIFIIGKSFKEIIKAIVAKRSQQDVIKKISNYSEEKALLLLTRCYHKNDDSLAEEEGWIYSIIKGI